MIDTVYRLVRLDFDAPRPYRNFRTGSTRVGNAAGRGTTETLVALWLFQPGLLLSRRTLTNKQ